MSFAKVLLMSPLVPPLFFGFFSPDSFSFRRYYYFILFGIWLSLDIVDVS